MDLSKVKKTLSILTICFTSIISLMLILLLFEVNLFGDSNLDFIVTFICLAVGCFFALNSISMINKNKLLGLISFGFIALSVVLIILFTWVNIENDFFLNFTISIGLLSVLFNIIVSTGLQLGKKYLVFQIIAYILVFIVDVLSTLMIFNAIEADSILTLFVLLIILSILSIVILKVFAKRQKNDIDTTSDKYVKITKEEYNSLLEKAKKYDELINK